MKIGSEAHKELFCKSFLESHKPYEAETLPWPDLDESTVERLRKIPFWDEALYTEQKAGVMLQTYADMVEDPLIREAIALQAAEEARHGRVIAHMIQRYGFDVPERPAPKMPTDMETGFVKFGYGECFDSFFAFGLFGIARQTDYIPESLFNIFDTLIDEEARHMVFFVNWIAHKQVAEGRGSLRPLNSLWQYTGALQRRLDNLRGMGSKKGKKPASKKGFTASGAKAVNVNISLDTFLETCLTENEKRMRVYPAELLRPEFLPAVAGVALNVVRVLPKKKAQPVADAA